MKRISWNWPLIHKLTHSHFAGYGFSTRGICSVRPVLHMPTCTTYQASKLDSELRQGQLHSHAPWMVPFPKLGVILPTSVCLTSSHNVETTGTLQRRCVVLYCSEHLNDTLIAVSSTSTTMKSKGNRSGEPGNVPYLAM